LKYDYLIVGAGFSGCVLAERLATQLQKKVLLIDKRPHIGGNAFDAGDEHGIRIHHYGPHLFHTNSERIVSYLSQFTQWRPYEHRVLSLVNGTFVPIPINRKTLSVLFQTTLENEEDAERLLAGERQQLPSVENSEDHVISKVGKKLYELLYKGYTTKQWGVEPSKLSPSVCGRIPVRTSLDDRYFDDQFQAMPMDGYTAMFRTMLAHENIHTELETSFRQVPSTLYENIIYTGPIDEYFEYIHGRLPYRSLTFSFTTHAQEYVQPVAQINYPNDFEYTRPLPPNIPPAPEIRIILFRMKRTNGYMNYTAKNLKRYTMYILSAVLPPINIIIWIR
jgi:UDP-galactopyranose mutase